MLIQTRYFIVFVCLLFAVPHSYANTLPENLQSTRPLPELTAKSWVLIEQQTGWVIAEKNADMPIEPASLTKLMSVYVIFSLLADEKIGLQDKVKISKNARYVEGSRMFAELSSELTVLELLKGVIVQSGNDASIALAEYVDGSEQGFVMRMNAAAEKMGLMNTQFANVTGLPDSNHYSSARDVALIGRAIIDDFPQYYSWFAMTEMTYNNIRQPNRNSLLNKVDWVDGLKTGHTESAGYCLAATGERDDQRFIAVVTGTNSDQQRSTEALSLLNYAFTNYDVFVPKPEQLARTIRVYGGKEDQVNLIAAQPLSLVVPKGTTDQIKLEYRVDDYLIAPINKQEDVGVLRVSYMDELAGISSVQTVSAVELGSLLKRITDRVKRLF